MGRSLCQLRCFSPVTIYMHEIKAIELVCGGALGVFKTRVAGEVFQPTAKPAFPGSFFQVHFSLLLHHNGPNDS